LFHDEVVAEIRTPPKIKPGEAAAGLLALRKRLGSKEYRIKPGEIAMVEGRK